VWLCDVDGDFRYLRPSFFRGTQAFGVAKYGRAHREVQRNLDRSHRKEHVPISDRDLDLDPPVIVVVMGPAGVGKSTLIKVRRVNV
jgi:ribosome biogenesis protein BMS1